MLCHERGQRDVLVSSQLWDHNDGPHLPDHRTVLRGLAKEVSTDLDPEVRDADELLQEVLGHHVRDTALLNLIRVHVDLVGPQVQGRG